jgi:hypothetical protein
MMEDIIRDCNISYILVTKNSDFRLDIGGNSLELYCIYIPETPRLSMPGQAVEDAKTLLDLDKEAKILCKSLELKVFDQRVWSYMNHMVYIDG